MSTEENPLGTRLKSFREAAGMTQQQLAVKAGLSISVVSQIEQGQKVDPRVSTAVALARALGLSVDELLSPRTGEATPADRPAAEKSAKRRKGKK
jgi:transcriptional regulator with XRE-family HTH domain